MPAAAPCEGPRGVLDRMDRLPAKHAQLAAAMILLPRAQIQSEELLFSLAARRGAALGGIRHLYTPCRVGL